MRSSTKIFFSLLSLAALAYVGLTAYGMWHLIWYRRWPFVMQPEGDTIAMFYFYGMATLAALTALLALGLLIRAITVRHRKRSLLLKAGDGEVHITEEAVESCVRSSLARYPDIRECDVRLSMQQKKTPGHIQVRTRCGIRENATLGPTVEAVQQQLKSDIENLTGATVETVDVSFYEAGQNQPTPQKGR